MEEAMPNPQNEPTGDAVPPTPGRHGGHPPWRMNRLHTVPENDLHEHVVEPDGLCPCVPRVLLPGPEQLSDGTWVQPDNSHARVAHNSYDGREVGEVARKALDLLGSALAGHNHDWSPEEREAFEHAVQVLDMHWPSKPAEPRLRRPFQ